MKIITHRGLDPLKENYYAESSREAFTDQLERGYGLEFDPQITKDGKVVILHDSNLKRISGGKDDRKISEVTLSEITRTEFNKCHLISFEELIDLIDKKQAKGAISAIHLKHNIQNKNDLDIILSYLEKADMNKFILFDVTQDTALYLKQKNNTLHLAPSVAHPHDILRYNNFVGGTLLTSEIALENTDLFDWVWLDEWDRADKNGKAKKLYTEELFKEIRTAGLKIGLVTPELHASSPSLLGSEKHQDAGDAKNLFDRIEEILKLEPDIICTDYPDEVKNIIKKINQNEIQ